MKTYHLNVPVFKQGDDLSQSIENHPNNLPDAFKEQQAQYEMAAEVCKRMASFCLDHPEITVDANCHTISIDGPEALLESLVKDDILYTMEYDGEYGELDSFEEDPDFNYEADYQDGNVSSDPENPVAFTPEELRELDTDKE